VIEILNGGCCHLGFRKTVVISEIFDQASPTVVDATSIDVVVVIFVTSKIQFSKSQDGGCRHFDLIAKTFYHFFAIWLINAKSALLRL